MNNGIWSRDAASKTMSVILVSVFYNGNAFFYITSMSTAEFDKQQVDVLRMKFWIDWSVIKINDWSNPTELINAANLDFCLNETDNLIESIINLFDKFSMVLGSWFFVVIMRRGGSMPHPINFYLYYYINFNWVQLPSFIYKILENTLK